MAFYDPKDDEEQNANNQQGGVQTAPESGIISGASGGSSNTPAAQGTTNAPDKPGNFVGIQQYLDANKPQSAKLGDQAAGVINTSADQARQGVSALSQEAQDKINPTSYLSSDVSSKLQNGAESLSNDERNTIKNTENAKYAGPQSSTDLASYQNAADATQKATTNINNSGTEQGRMNLVSQINSKPRTNGDNIFDNALLQAGGGREKLAQAASANQDAVTGLDAANTAISQKIGRADDPNTPDIDESSGAIGQTNKAQADAYNQVQNALNAWQTGFTPKVTAAQNKLTDEENRVTQDIGDNPYGLSDETMQLLGLTGGTDIYNLDLNKYLNSVSPGDITAANVATPQDYARYSALSDLAGTDPTVLNPNDASLAGTAPTLTANQAQLQRDIAAANGAYQNAYDNTRTGVLNNGYLSNPGAAQGYAGGIPGALTSRTDLNTATPQELENFWLPLFQKASNLDGGKAWYQPEYDAIYKSLADWKKSQHVGNIVNPTASLPTNSDGSIDWSQINAPTGK